MGNSFEDRSLSYYNGFLLHHMETEKSEVEMPNDEGLRKLLIRILSEKPPVLAMYQKEFGKDILDLLKLNDGSSQEAIEKMKSIVNNGLKYNVPDLKLYRRSFLGKTLGRLFKGYMPKVA